MNPCTDCPVYNGQPFNFAPITAPEVQKALQAIDHRKSSAPDLIEPYFLKMGADFVAKSLAKLLTMLWKTMKFPPYGNQLCFPFVKKKAGGWGVGGEIQQF